MQPHPDRPEATTPQGRPGWIYAVLAIPLLIATLVILHLTGVVG